MGVGYLAVWLEERLGGLYGPAMGAIKVAVVVAVSLILVRLGRYIIKKIFTGDKYFKHAVDERKAATVATLLASIYRYSVYIIAGIVILTDVFKLTSVLAAAGIGGLAVGLGAQSFIKDVISGFFIVIENQYAVGDLITVDSFNGTVEEMELRVTKIRNFNGDLYVIPNGEIRKVINHTKDFKAVIVDIPVAYGSGVGKAEEIAAGVCERVSKEFASIVEKPKVLGITALDRFSFNLRIFGKALPNTQWEIERRIRKLIKEEFDRENVRFFDRNIIAPDEDASGR